MITFMFYVLPLDLYMYMHGIFSNIISAPGAYTCRLSEVGLRFEFKPGAYTQMY